jgi:tRNA (cytidine/uridine-2'-O-)-methyltransferase
MKVILYQPQIPQNTGNIVRTCSVTGSDLVLVHPLGFSITSKHLKRAGLDYWEGVSIQEIQNLESYLENTDTSFFFFSSKATKYYTDAPYEKNSLLIFGSETSGIDPIFFEKWPDRFYKIPMIENTRCINLATSVGIVLYEALRQTHFFEKRKREHIDAATSDDVNGK